MKHICLDWDGTIAKKEVSEEASLRMCKTLDIGMTSEEMREMQKTHAHYAVTQEAIQKYTGVKDKRLQTAIMTSTFQLHYLGVVNEWKQDCFYPGMKDSLQALVKQGATLSIVTTLRTDIIEPALEVLKMRNLFGKIYGNTPDLAFSKEQLIQQALTDCGEVHAMVGDREEDLRAGRSVSAKTAYSMWGHGELKDKKLADAVLEMPGDLLSFAKTL